VVTSAARYDAGGNVVKLEGELTSLGLAPMVDVGFEYRDVTGLDLTESATGTEYLPSPRRPSTPAPHHVWQRVKGSDPVTYSRNPAPVRISPNSR
jgi:hypothetical protein